MKRKHIIIFLTVLATAAVMGITAILLVYNGVILLNNPSKEKYPVRGVDVSHYQGDIDWQTLASQDIDFAFIKATEGSTYVDEKFAENYEQAQKTHLRVGAYHFFSYDSPGLAQAENFINTVTPVENMLPPVIDLEFYGDKEQNPPDREDVTRELNAFIGKIEEHYGMKPIIYATEKSYKMYLSGDYEDCDIWIRDVIFSPSLSDGRDWTFWQYTNRARLDGYYGDEKYIDINVFRGTKEEFESYGR